MCRIAPASKDRLPGIQMRLFECGRGTGISNSYSERLAEIIDFNCFCFNGLLKWYFGESGAQ
jgi:hypothetical protein